MKPISLRVKNFASYRNETFNYDDINGLAAVTGQNGGGKSSFFVDAMTTVLFNRARGTSSQGTGLENLISTGEDELEVEFIFESNSSEIKAIRRRFLKGGQELELFIDGVDHTDKIKETQAKLQSLIKIDYDTFLDTVCIGQGESGRFMKKAPNERKEVFTQVLNLDNYDVLQDFTKEIKKETNDKIKSRKEKLEELGNDNDKQSEYEDRIKLGESETVRLQFDIEIKESDLESELREKTKYEEIVKNRDEILSKQRNLQSKVNQINDSITKGTQVKNNLESTLLTKDEVNEKLNTAENELEEAQSLYTTLTSEKSSLEATNNLLSGQATELKAKYSRLKDFNEASCEFCGQEVTESHKQSHLDQLMTEGKKYIVQINGNKTKIEELNSEISNANLKISTTRSSIQSLRSKKSEIEQAETKLSSVSSRLTELEVELVDREKELEEALAIKVDNVESRTFNDSMIRSELRNLRQELSDWESKIAIARNELTKIEKNKDKVIDIEKEIKELQEEVSLLDELVTAWGKEGIQAIIIDNALPEIQDEINEFLGILTDQRVSIEFVTQKEKGKGKKVSSIETLDIVIHDENGARTYETYSGGEKFRVDFSCHVGLSKFLAKRAGANINFFIVDEGIGSQDETAKDHFINAVQKLTTIFDKVLVITHIQDIIESFPNKIEVYKDPIDGSKIRIA